MARTAGQLLGLDGKSGLGLGWQEMITSEGITDENDLRLGRGRLPMGM